MPCGGAQERLASLTRTPLSRLGPCTRVTPGGWGVVRQPPPSALGPNRARLTKGAALCPTISRAASKKVGHVKCDRYCFSCSCRVGHLRRHVQSRQGKGLGLVLGDSSPRPDGDPVPDRHPGRLDLSTGTREETSDSRHRVFCKCQGDVLRVLWRGIGTRGPVLWIMREPCVVLRQRNHAIEFLYHLRDATCGRRCVLLRMRLTRLSGTTGFNGHRQPT